MIKFVAEGKTPGEKLVGLGLSRVNCERLLAGQPIPVDLAKLGLPFPVLVVLLGGETEAAIVADLQRNGCQFPSDPAKIHIVDQDQTEQTRSQKMTPADIIVGALYKREDDIYLGCGHREMFRGDLTNAAPMEGRFLVCISENEGKGLIVKTGDDVVPGYWNDFVLIEKP